MDQWWDQEKNQKIPWNKWKKEYNNPKSMGHWESNPKREIHSITRLPQKSIKSSNKQLTLHWKELEKEQQSPKWAKGRK